MPSTVHQANHVGSHPTGTLQPRVSTQALSPPANGLPGYIPGRPLPLLVLLRKSGEHLLKQEVFYGRGIRFTTEFKREAVRLVLSSGRPRTEIAEDLGVGLSSLTRWIGQYRGEEMPPEIRDDLQAELKRLRKENAVLRQERDILKKAAAFFAKEGSR